VSGSEDRQIYAVVVSLGEECYGRHRLDYFPDGIVCVDCSHAAAQAACDAVNPDLAVRSFRDWSWRRSPSRRYDRGDGDRESSDLRGSPGGTRAHTGTIPAPRSTEGRHGY
jgi:hypothetical protein